MSRKSFNHLNIIKGITLEVTGEVQRGTDGAFKHATKESEYLSL